MPLEFYSGICADGRTEAVASVSAAHEAFYFGRGERPLAGSSLADSGAIGFYGVSIFSDAKAGSEYAPSAAATALFPES